MKNKVSRNKLEPILNAEILIDLKTVEPFDTLKYNLSLTWVFNPDEENLKSLKDTLDKWGIKSQENSKKESTRYVLYLNVLGYRLSYILPFLEQALVTICKVENVKYTDYLKSYKERKV